MIEDFEDLPVPENNIDPQAIENDIVDAALLRWRLPQLPQELQQLRIVREQIIGQLPQPPQHHQQLHIAREQMIQQHQQQQHQMDQIILAIEDDIIDAALLRGRVPQIPQQFHQLRIVREQIVQQHRQQQHQMDQMMQQQQQQQHQIGARNDWQQMIRNEMPPAPQNGVNGQRMLINNGRRVSQRLRNIAARGQNSNGRGTQRAQEQPSTRRRNSAIQPTRENEGSSSSSSSRRGNATSRASRGRGIRATKAGAKSRSK